MQRLKLRRVLMLLGVIAGVPGIALVQARAELEQTLLEQTAGLFALARHWQRAQPRALFLNGARIVVATGSSEQPVAAMLDHFQEHCRRQSGGLHELAQAAMHSARAGLPSLVDGVLRVEEEHQGLVACLALGEARLGAAELMDRIERFSDALDLAELGGLRVVRVQALGEGSFFVAAWNDGPLALTRMFPEQGDSQGVDPAGLPRPARARRVLSAWQEGVPSSIQLYESAQARDEAFAGYTEELERAGWRMQDVTNLHGGASVNGALFARGGKSLVVHTQPDGRGSLISVLPMELRENREVTSVK